METSRSEDAAGAAPSKTSHASPVQASPRQGLPRRAVPHPASAEADHRPQPGQVEERSAAAETDGKRVYGLVPYGVVGDVGEFRERIERGALANTDFSKLKVVIDHQDRGLPLARYPATLTVSETPDGLHWSFKPPESRTDVIEALERGDIAGSSWRMRVARDRWEGDLRSITEIAELVDVTLAGSSDPVYPTAVEYRSRPATGQEDTTMSDTAQPANEPENQNQPEGLAEERSERPPAGSLRVSDRTADAPVRWQSMADLVADRGFLEGRRVRIGFDEYRSLTWSGGTVLLDVNPLRREGVGMGFDTRWLYPSLPTTTVSDAATSVQYLRQSARTLAGTAVIRPLDATTTKPETSSTIEFVEQQLQQVATLQTGVPRIHFNQSAFRSIAETDLRYSVADGLDEIARRGIALAGTIVKGTDDILEVTRKAMTLVQADGYNPDTLAIDPAGAQSLDLLRTPGSEKMYIFTPGQFAGGPVGSAPPGVEAGRHGGARLAGLRADVRRADRAALV
jgi:HK97 family phage prohead protease